MCYYMKGFCLFNLGRYLEAISSHKKGLEIESSFYGFY